MSNPSAWLDVFPRPFAVLGPGGVVRFANGAFTCVFGMRSMDAGAATEALQSSGELHDKLVRTMSRLRINGRTARFRWTPAGQAERIYGVQVTRAADDEWVVSLDDVSGQTAVDAIHHQARGFLETILNQLKVAVVVLDDCVHRQPDEHRAARPDDPDGRPGSLFESIGQPIADLYPVFTRDEWDGIYSRVCGGHETVKWTKIGYPRCRSHQVLHHHGGSHR